MNWGILVADTKVVGIVVPTLGLRHDYLLQCLRSIRDAGEVHVCIIAPSSVDLGIFFELGLIDQRVNDPGCGLSSAIDLGLQSLPLNIEYMNWLGDDDLLRPGSISEAADYLYAHPDVSLVFGSCDYINEESTIIGTNKSGKWAVPLLRFGPCLIPQPGALFRRDTYETIGGLSRDFEWAFDFEFFIRLSRFGELQYIPITLAAFRWHQGSLSVGGRKHSAREASRARRLHLPSPLRIISAAWESPVRLLTAYAGPIVSFRARKIGYRNATGSRTKCTPTNE